MIEAYLSHRREGAELSPFAQSLLNWAPADIGLKVDCYDAEPSRSIEAFISKIKTSSNVVFALNDGFFESRWCMEELHAFVKNRNPKYHGFFIACEGWLPRSDVDQFFSNYETKLKKRWHSFHFCDAIPRMLSQLQALNIPTDEQIIETEAVSIWNRFRENREKVRAYSGHIPAGIDEFDRECRKWMLKRLKRSNTLRQALANNVDLPEDAAGSVDAIVHQLWQLNTRDRLSKFYMGAREALEDCAAEHKNKLENDIRDLLAVFLLAYFDPKARKEIVSGQYGLYDSEFLGISEEREEMAELLFIGAEPTMSAKLMYDSHDKKLVVNRKERYLSGDQIQREVSDSNANGAVIDEELKLIWGWAIPDAPKGHNEYLSKEDITRLAVELKKKFDRGLARYYLVPADNPGHPLHQPGVIDGLKAKLPCLFVLRLGIPARPALIAAEFGRDEIGDELRNFADLFG